MDPAVPGRGHRAEIGASCRVPSREVSGSMGHSRARGPGEEVAPRCPPARCRSRVRSVKPPAGGETAQHEKVVLALVEQGEHACDHGHAAGASGSIEEAGQLGLGRAEQHSRTTSSPTATSATTRETCGETSGRPRAVVRSWESASASALVSSALGARSTREVSPEPSTFG